MLHKIATVLMGLLTLGVVYFYNRYDKAQKELQKLSNNLVYYQNLTSNIETENRTLQLTIDQLQNSRDSVINKLNEQAKQLDIKDKELVQAQYQKQSVKDSIKVIVPERNINFKEVLKMNEQTFITVSRTDSILDVKLDLTNEQFLYIKKKKVYRNQYKNGWVRFWHFDWKKDTVHEYEIKNSNDLIKVTETRVIEL